MTAAKCRACKRPLSDRESRERGYGPACWRARQPQPVGAIIRNLPLVRRGRGEPMPGQQELDINGEHT